MDRCETLSLSTSLLEAPRLRYVASFFPFVLSFHSVVFFAVARRSGVKDAAKHKISRNKNKHNNRTCDQIRSSRSLSLSLPGCSQCCRCMGIRFYIFAFPFPLLLLPPPPPLRHCHRHRLPLLFFIRQPGRRRCIFFLWLTTDSLGMWSIAFISGAQSMRYI